MPAGDFNYIGIPHSHMQGFLAQARPLAGRTNLLVHILRQLLANVLGTGLPEAALQVANYALKGSLKCCLATVSITVKYCYTFALRTVQHQVEFCCGQITNRCTEVNIVLLGYSFQCLPIIPAFFTRTAPLRNCNRTLVKRQIRVRDQQIGSNFQFAA